MVILIEFYSTNFKTCELRCIFSFHNFIKMNYDLSFKQDCAFYKNNGPK